MAKKKAQAREYVWLQCSETGDLNYRTELNTKGGIPEGGPGPLDEHPQVGAGVGRHPLRPERFGQDIAGHEDAPAGDEQPDEDPHQPAAEARRRHLLGRTAHQEAPQQLDLDRAHWAPCCRTARRYETATGHPYRPHQRHERHCPMTPAGERGGER